MKYSIENYSKVHYNFLSFSIYLLKAEKNKLNIYDNLLQIFDLRYKFEFEMNAQIHNLCNIMRIRTCKT